MSGPQDHRPGRVIFPAPAGQEPIRILVADDDRLLREALREFLERSGRTIDVQAGGGEAVQALGRSPVDLVITDLRMSGADGLQILAEAKRRRPDSVVILMTGYASLDTALQAIRGGAYDYIRKPFKMEELEIAVGNACEKILMARENRRLREILQRSSAEKPFPDAPPGSGPRLAEVDFTLQQIPPELAWTKMEAPATVVQDLERICALRKSGFLNEAEFGKLKRALLQKI